MLTIGIVAEYAPFHNGHALHIRRSRELAGEDSCVVCVMSGQFIQRGEPAVFDKHSRAEAALRCGADLVLELPLPFALASAERFAYGAVALLDSLGCVDYLSFGSESGELDELLETAELLARPELDAAMRRTLREGMSFAAARQQAAEALSGRPLELLRAPNNILALEYLKALRRLRSPIRPMTIRRVGAGHDAGEAKAGLPSASMLREKLRAGADIAPFVPPAAHAVYRRELEAGRGPVSILSLETAILARLRRMQAADFAALPDATEGLDRRLMHYAHTCATLQGLYDSVKTRRYAMARIKRMVLAAFLGMTAETCPARPPYARVLAVGERGMAVLKTASERIAVLTKPAGIRRLDAQAQALFALEALATDLYALAYPDAGSRIGGAEWRRSPFILSPGMV